MRLFRDVERTARAIEVETGQLETIARGSARLEASPGQALLTVREQINNAGKELRTLDSDRASLPSFEQRSLDQIEPLVADAARNETLAIEAYNSRTLAWPLSSEFQSHVEHVRADGDRIAKILSERLKLAKAKQTERKLEQILGEPGN